MTSEIPGQARISWQWDESTTGKHGAADSVLQAEDGSRFVSARLTDSEVIELQRLRKIGTSPLWVQRIPALGANVVVFLHYAGKLYSALYSSNTTGCRVLAQDADSGDVIWETILKGLGPLHHSKYSNRVQMRFMNGQLTIFGNESGGKYVEILEANSGQLKAHQVFQ